MDAPTATQLILLSNSVVLFVFAAYAWRTQNTPAGLAFAVLQAVAALWAAVTLVGLTLPPGVLRVRLWGVTTAISLLIVPLWLWFILSYSGRFERLPWRALLAVATPLWAGAVLYAAVPAWDPLVAAVTQRRTPSGTFVRGVVGPVGGAAGVYIYAVFAVGLVVAGVDAVRESDRLASQTVAFVLGTLVTVVASVLRIAGVPTQGYPLAQVALSGQSVFWGYAVFRQQFLTFSPAVTRIGRTTAFDTVDDGIVVVNDGTVTDANPEAERSLDDTDLVGLSVGRVFDRLGVDEADLPTRGRRDGQVYQVESSPMTDWRDRPVGQVLLIRDVTELVGRNQRLQVFNRVLRHNVRNDMNVVFGRARQIQEVADGTVAEHGEQIAAVAADLVTVGRKARSAATVFGGEATTRRVALDDLVGEVATAVGEEYPEASIDTTGVGGRLRTNPETLRLVVRETIENAAAHAGVSPSVEIWTERADGETQITVADDGPGVPPDELEPVRSGTETDLTHASSLGLWLIHWGVQSLGGAFDVENDDGAVVTLSLPAADDDA